MIKWIGLISCTATTIFAASSVGDLPSNCTEPYNWSIVFGTAMMTYGFFALGYLAGRIDGDV